MSKLPQVKAREIMKILKRQGFISRSGKGSHVVLKHPDGRRTVLPMHNKPIAKGTLNSILRQTHIPLEKFLKLLKE